MAIVSQTFKKGEKLPPLTDEQKAMLARLKNLPDDAIDTSNDWDDVVECEALTVQSDKNLVINFTKICREQRLNVNDVINQLMRTYVKQNQAVL